MKTLFITRHAKSSWEHPVSSDLERPVIENGIRKTKKIIEFLLQEKITLDYIMCSHATRAIETAYLLSDGLNYPRENIDINPNIYESNEEGLLNEVFALPNDKDNVIVIGHNPALTQFANYFLLQKIDFMPTSAMVSISFDTNAWEKIMSSPEKLNFIAFPKKLK